MSTRVGITFGNLGTDRDEKSWRAGEQRWRDTSAALYGRLRGSCEDTLFELRRVYPATWTMYSPRPSGFIGWITRQIALTYTEEPAITYVDEATGQPVEDKVARFIAKVRTDAGVTTAMLAASEEMVATGNGVVWVTPVSRNGKMGVECQVLPAHTQQVHLATRPMSADERDVTLWRLRLPVPGDTDQDGYAQVTPTTAVWESATGGLEGKPLWDRSDPAAPSNQLGQIPATVLRWSPPRAGSFWADAREELLYQARALDAGATDMGEVVRHQGFGQWIAKGVKGGGTVKMGFGTVVELERDGEMKCESPKPDLNGSLAALEAYARIATASQDGNPATLLRSTAITAEGKKIEIADREGLRRRHLKEFARAEQRIYDLLRQWYLVLGLGALPKVRLEIEFPAPEMPENGLQAEQACKLRIEMGQSSEIRERMRRDRCSYGEAKKRVLQDIRDQGELRKARIEAGLIELPALPVAPAQSDAKGPAVVTDDVQKTALNGAQVASLLAMLLELAQRGLPEAAAREAILLSFPEFDTAAVDRMLKAFGKFQPPAQEAA